MVFVLTLAWPAFKNSDLEFSEHFCKGSGNELEREEQGLVGGAMRWKGEGTRHELK